MKGPLTSSGILLTCEHAGNQIPEEFQAWFASPGASRQLRSHRGYDPGALTIAQGLAQRLDAELHFSHVSRLLVELNRSLDSPQLFSRFSERMSLRLRNRIVREHYMPLRRATRQSIEQFLASGAVAIHCSIHTFTPRFCGSYRNYDIGVLFDPARPLESRLSRRILRQLRTRGLRAEANRPYLGTADGHTTELRQVFSASNYVGIEFELSNRIARLSVPTQQLWVDHIADAVIASLN